MPDRPSARSWQLDSSWTPICGIWRCEVLRILVKISRQDGHLREQHKRHIAYACMGASTAYMGLPIILFYKQIEVLHRATRHPTCEYRKSWKRLAVTDYTLCSFFLRRPLLKFDLAAALFTVCTSYLRTPETNLQLSVINCNALGHRNMKNIPIIYCVTRQKGKHVSSSCECHCFHNYD